jgi:hypothetical protein
MLLYHYKGKPGEGKDISEFFRKIVQKSTCKYMQKVEKYILFTKIKIFTYFFWSNVLE